VLENLFSNNFKEHWVKLFNFLPNKLNGQQIKKSAIISLLLASLNKVKDGKIEITQKTNYDKIMVKVK